jgi:GNAT superfamily N-acetyltransferase
VTLAEQRCGDYLISTDKTKLDLNLIHDYLSNCSYWAKGRPFDVFHKSTQHSLCFGVYTGDQQVGFTRVVTDYTTFAWVCDVFILETHQGKGLGKWLVECVVAHPELRGLKQILLATRNAHELYQKYGGFQQLEAPGKWMVRRKG